MFIFPNLILLIFGAMLLDLFAKAKLIVPEDVPVMPVSL
jgi:hypothetical protein